MDELIIVGAGGLGREIYSWAVQCPEHGKDWKVKGFLDDDLEALNGFDYPVPLLGNIADYQPNAGEVFLMGIGIVDAKKAISQRLKSRGARFVSMVHPSATLGHNVSLGEGVVICPQVTLTTEVIIEDFVLVNCNSCVGHDSRVGAWSTISANCDVTGYCTLGEGVFLGSGVSIIPERTIGGGATLGAGATVFQDVAHGETVVCMPAKPLM